MWNLKYDTNLFTKQKQTHRHRKQTYNYWSRDGESKTKKEKKIDGYAVPTEEGTGQWKGGGGTENTLCILAGGLCISEGKTRKTQGEAIRRTMLQFCFACAGGRSTREPKLDTRVGFWDSDLGVFGEQVMREWGGLEMGENTASAYVDDRLREAWRGTSGGCPWPLGGWGQENQKFLSPAFLSAHDTDWGRGGREHGPIHCEPSASAFLE